MGKDTLRSVRALLIKADEDPDLNVGPTSIQIPDPFDGLYTSNGLIDPIIDPSSLLSMPEQNNILLPLIASYKTNMVGFGADVKPVVADNDPDLASEIKDQIAADKVTLMSFYDNCNFDESLESVLMKMIDDRERVGYGVLEVIPEASGLPCGLEHMLATTVRMTKLDPRPQTIKVERLNIDGTPVSITHIKKFRRYCQIVDNTKVWFKEFGDPRDVDSISGAFYEDMKDVSEAKLANSVIFFNIYSPHTPYGQPRYMGNTLSIVGSRKSEELNYNYFVNGKHIPMAILVKNGSLTESSIDEIKKYSNSIKGVDNAHGYLILEAEGFDTENPDPLSNNNGKSAVDIQIKPLVDVLQKDGLFQVYDKNNRSRIRADFRLPPIYTGESEDYTRATADTARGIAEEQIFNPERNLLASKLNRLINPALGVNYVKLYFKGPDLTNKVELSTAVDIYRKAGVLTPNMLIKAASELLGIELDKFTEEWGDKPIEIVKEELRNDVLVTDIGKADKEENSTDPDGDDTVVDPNPIDDDTIDEPEEPEE